MSNVRKGVKGFVRRDPIARFWERVDKTPGHGPGGDCWLWTGSKKRGYGVLWVDGTLLRAHRFSWELANGRALPRELHGCHKCDNPPCVNPEHIFPGTMSENILDAVRKGRMATPTARGAPGWQAKLTHCKRGHEFTPENIIPKPPNRRLCRACHEAYREQYNIRCRKGYVAPPPLSPEKE